VSVGEAGVTELHEAIQRGIALAAGSGRPEAVLRENVEPALENALRIRGARATGRTEVSLAVPTEAEADALDAPLATAGRADAIFNRFVIEFEPPAALRPSVAHSATRHAVAQVQQYLRGFADSSGLSLERCAGCAFDGTWIVYINWEQGGWRVARPRPVDLESLRALVDSLESLSSGRGLTAQNLVEDFGRDSRVAHRLVGALAKTFLGGDPSPRAEAMFRQWREELGEAGGFPRTNDLPEWLALTDALGLPSDEASSDYALFSLQTYFAIVARLIALVVLEGATGHSLVPQLREGGNLKNGFLALEAGWITLPTQALNVIEPGVFSWYVREQDPDIWDALDGAVDAISEYSAEVVAVTPSAARDVLKDLYQRLVPRAIRHRLGEFYTPDWLARRVVEQLIGEETIEPSARVLDPACGSGTFLVEIITRMVAAAEEQPDADTLRAITTNVVGYDLTPLAVQAAKVSYLLALAPLLRSASAPVVIPVFLADSVAPPRTGGLFEGEVLVLKTTEGEWLLHRSLATQDRLSQLGLVFASGVAERAAAENVMTDLQEALPDVDWSDAAVVDTTRDLYATLLRLDIEDRDGLWWNLIVNAMAPVFEDPFDYIVGNPPWVSWETLPKDYRRANDSQWDLYSLRPDPPPGRRQSSTSVQLDLSMLFVAHCIDRYLAERGRLGFVITASVFRSELAGRGFRRRHLPSGKTYRFRNVEDLSRLSVFDDASNRAAVLIADLDSRDETIPFTVWLPRESASIAVNAELAHVLDRVDLVEARAEPVDPNDPASPLLVMDATSLQASRPLRRPSPYVDLIREGVNTRGANGIFFVDVLATEGEFLRVRNDPARGRNREVPTVEGLVEAAAVRGLVRGEDVSRGAARSKLGVLFFHDRQHVSQPLTEQEAERLYPSAVKFARNFETFLRRRRQFRNFDPSGDQWLGLYSVTTACLAQHRVVVREIAQGMIAAVLEDANHVPDHKLYVVGCSSADEARLLAQTLNSDVVDGLLRAFTLSTSITGSFLRYIGIGRVSENDAADDEEHLATTLNVTLQQLRELREALADSPLVA
jgi:SAM-dependent methyltransferase